MDKKQYSVPIVSANLDKKKLEGLGKVFGIIAISPLTMKREKLLEWFRDFAYTDIDRLKDEEIAKLYAEYRSVITGGLDMLDMYGVHNFGRDLKEFGILKDHQIWFKGAFNAVMEKINSIANYEMKQWSSDPECFSNFGYFPMTTKTPPSAFFFELIPEPLEVEFQTLSYIEITDEKQRIKNKEDNQGENQEARWDPNWRETSTIHTKSYPVTFSSSCFLRAFLEALDGVKYKMCKQCAECNHWFFNLSNHTRFYCSNRCAARKRMRENRAELKNKNNEGYERELDKSRKRADKSHVKRMARRYKRYQKIKEAKDY